MTEKNPFDESFQEMILYLTKRLDDRELDRMKSVVIGGGSVSMAIILVLLQVGMKATSLKVSLWASSLGIPAWIGAWQFIDAYMFYGKMSMEHFSQARGSGILAGMIFSSLLLLFISVFSAILYLSSLGAGLFTLASIVISILVHRHGIQLRVAVDKAEKNQSIEPVPSEPNK
jgi:hypothetical protein